MLLAIYTVFTCAELSFWGAGRLPGAGTIGAEQAQLTVDASAPGFVTVGEVAKGSPLDRAGVMAGDRLRFDPVFDYLRYRQAGDAVRGEVDRAGRRFGLSVKAAPRVAPPDWEAVRFYLGNLIPALFGGLIVWRNRRGVAGLLLGAAMITFGPPSPSAMMWEGASPAGFLFFALLNRLSIVAVGFFLLAFAMRFVAESVGGVGRRQWRALAVYGASCVPVLAIWSWCDLTATMLPVIGNGAGLVSVIGYVGFAASMAYLAIGWRRTAKAERNRFALFLVGVAALIVAQVISYVVFLNLAGLYSVSHPLLIVAEILSGIFAPAFLTHAILRHRVLDMGFILNRTLVYGAVSAMLLIAFGLVERGVDELVTIEGREQNALVDAAIALGIYLLFHRFRHTAEHMMERFFFRRWHEKEAGLRRAIDHAGFITTPPALIAAVRDALGRFGEGASVTIALKDDAGDYRDGADLAIGRDDAIAVELRAEGKPIRPEAAGVTGVELALPMTHRRELIGIVLLGPKAGGDDYRVDEVDVLAWAAHQAGLDLHALKLDRLTTTVRDQEQQIRILTARWEGMRAAMPTA